MPLNYRSLMPDELERLAFLGDDKARLALADVGDMIPHAQAEQESADALEEGEAAGYKRAYEFLHKSYAEAILAASNGNRDEDVCESLKGLLAELEDHS